VKIVNEYGADDKEAEVGLVLVQVFGVGTSVFAVVGDGGVVGLRFDLRYGPGFAGVVGEGEVGAVLVGMFVVAAGDHAVSWIAKGDGEDSGGVGAVEDGSVEDLPGLAAVGGVKDAGCFATGGEPDVGIGDL